jgi:hypothetical protein
LQFAPLDLDTVLPAMFRLPYRANRDAEEMF